MQPPITPLNRLHNHPLPRWWSAEKPPTCGILPKKVPHGSLSLGHADDPLRHMALLIPPRREILIPPERESLIPPGYLISEILFGQRSTLSRCLTAAILSSRHPTFFGYLTSGACPADVPTSLDRHVRILR